MLEFPGIKFLFTANEKQYHRFDIFTFLLELAEIVFAYKSNGKLCSTVISTNRQHNFINIIIENLQNVKMLYPGSQIVG